MIYSSGVFYVQGRNEMTYAVSPEMFGIALAMLGGMVGYAIRMERLLTKLVTEMEQSNKQHAKTETFISVLDGRLDDHDARIRMIESK
jgi:uncharacterized membrane protein YqgA involved in biofilm formation